MNASIRDWLGNLKQQAEAKNLEHLDLLINATLLHYPVLQRLAELDPPPLHSLLFENTPEHALASEGPILVRVFWEQPAQMAWLGEFLTQFYWESRALLMMSYWPFEALTTHLRYCTQAHWDKGANSGILRYYDTRLFKHIASLFVGDAYHNFHAAVISWHWIDRDHNAQAIGGTYCKPNEFIAPQGPLMLDERQVRSANAWSKAEQWEQTHGLSKRNYTVGKEQLIAQIFLAQLAASDKHLKGQAHTDFIVEWLAQYLPENLPQTDSLV